MLPYHHGTRSYLHDNISLLFLSVGYTNIPGVAKDWFGQSWTYEPKIKAANPTPGIHLVPDITRWKEYMKFPDLSKLDWEGHAAVDKKIGTVYIS